MKMNIIKRDGRMEPFDEEKLVGSIKKAMIDAKLKIDEQEVQHIMSKVHANLGAEDIDVSKIRNSVLDELERSKEAAAVAWRNFDGKYKVR